MSYDIDLRKEKCPACGHAESAGRHLPDPTYNLFDIFELAMTGKHLPPGTKTGTSRDICILDGRLAGDTIPELQAAMVRMNDPTLTKQFLALEPSNKWGDFRGACDVMERLLDAAKAYPDYIWEIR